MTAASRTVVVALTLAGWRAARDAWAQTDAREAEARAHFDRGVALMTAHRYADAAVEFDHVRQIHPTPAVYFNLGLAQRLVGQNLEAIASLRQSLDERGAGVAPERRREIEGYIAELMGRLGRVALHVEPADARVRVDDRAVAQGTLTIEVDPGHHVVFAQADGYAASRREFDVVGGARVDVALALSREVPVAPHTEPAPPPRITAIRVEVDAPRAVVRIDGRAIALPPGARVVVRPGHHVVEVAAPGRVRSTQQLDIDEGTEVQIHARLAPAHDVAASPWLWTTVGGVVVAGAAAVIIGLLANEPRAPYVGGWGSATSLTSGRPGVGP